MRVDAELRMDCMVWQQFLGTQDSVTRPFVDHKLTLVADEFLFTTDASRNKNLGIGGIAALTQLYGKSEFEQLFPNENYEDKWFHVLWEPGFIDSSDCSIEVCEMMGVATATVLFSKFFRNKRIIIFCDNQAVMHMLNSASSACKKCMYLLRVITAESLRHNVRYFCWYIDTKANILSDLLSRNKIGRFRRLAPATIAEQPEILPSTLWPIPAYLWAPSVLKKRRSKKSNH